MLTETLEQNDSITKRDLKKAIQASTGDMFIVLQPIVRLVTYKVYGFECLLRYEGEHDKHVSPIDILRSAKTYDLAQDLDWWIIKRSLTEFSKVNSMLKDTVIKCFINIPPSNLLWLNETKNEILQFAKSLNIKSEQLVFELTEDEPVKHPAQIESIKSIQNKNMLIAIDDFGSGLANFVAINRLNANYIKIDKSLLEEIDTCRKQYGLYKNIAKMITTGGAIAVCEGVETREQSRALESMGLSNMLAQGYLYSTPQKINTIKRAKVA